jgi:hypothetical protein
MNREEIKEELLLDIKNNNLDLDDYEERLFEYADSAVPVYHYEIVKEWQEMPAEYNDRAQDDFGTEGGIFRLMSNDIYLYALDLYREVIEEIAEEIKKSNLVNKIEEDLIKDAPDKESADWLKNSIDSGKIIIQFL